MKDNGQTDYMVIVEVEMVVNREAAEELRQYWLNSDDMEEHVVISLDESVVLSRLRSVWLR